MTLINGLPDDISQFCLARLPLNDLSQARLVCNSWRRVLQWESIHAIRKKYNLSENIFVAWNSSKAETTQSAMFDSSGAQVVPCRFMESYIWDFLKKTMAILEFESARKRLELVYKFQNLFPELKHLKSLNPDNGIYEYLKFVESSNRLWNISSLQELKGKRISIWSDDDIFTVSSSEGSAIEITKWCDNGSRIQVPESALDHEMQGCVVLHKRLYVFRCDHANPNFDSGRLDIYDVERSTWTTVSKVLSPYKYYRGPVAICDGVIHGLLSTNLKFSLGRVVVAALNTVDWSWEEIAELPAFDTDEGVPFIDTCYLASFGTKLIVFCNGGVAKKMGLFENVGVARNWMNVLDLADRSWIVRNKVVHCSVESFAVFSY